METVPTPPVSVVDGPRVGLGRVAWAFVRRNAAIASTYRLTFIVRAFWTMGTLLSLAMLSRFVDPSASAFPRERYGQGGYLGFWVTGLCVGMVFEAGAASLSRRIRDAQVEGTLEAMLATPAPTATVVLAAPLWDLLGAFLRLLVIWTGAVVLFQIPVGPVNILSVAILSVLVVLGSLCLGVLGGALAMTLRRSEPISLLVGSAGVLLGGILYPPAVLPGVLSELAYAFPLAPGLEGIRRALFADASVVTLGREIAWLVGFLVVAGPICVGVFVLALRRARRDGSLSQY